ncbi:MAG: response regulator [Halioglobus sp.]
MHTDNDPGKNLDAGHESEEEGREKGLQWLLDMDMSEPEETLFTVSGDEYQDEGLSAFEAEVAGRPLVRGNTGGDDLANYVDEEIVISSEGGSDIFKEGAAADDADAQDDRPEVMAVDYSLGRKTTATQKSEAVDAGTDILGLQSDDDIGEKYLTIKRVKGAAKVQHDETSVASESEAESIKTPVESKELSGIELSLEDSTDEGLELEGAADQSFDLELSDVNDVIGVDEHDQTACVDPADDLSGIQLSEAPTPSQVAAPGSEFVANDELEELSLDGIAVDEVSLEVEEPAANAPSDDPLGGAMSLADAAMMLAPAGESEAESAADAETDYEPEAIDLGEAVSADDATTFLSDEFSGEQAFQFEEELVDEPAEAFGLDDDVYAQGDESIDLVEEFEAFAEGEEESIDFPAEFEALEGVNDSDAVATAAAMPTVIEELSQRVAARASELGMDAAAVVADVRMATDESSPASFAQDGFVPLALVCADLGASTASLSEAQIDSIYASLQSSDSADNWNHFFEDSFQVPETIAGNTPEDLVAAEDTVVDVGSDDIFGADFADDLSDDFASGLVDSLDAPGESNSDIDAIFAELSDEEESVLGADASELVQNEAEVAEEIALEAVEIGADLESKQDILEPEVEQEAAADAELDQDKPSEEESSAIQIATQESEVEVEVDVEALSPEVEVVDVSEAPEETDQVQELVAENQEVAIGGALTVMIGATDASNPKWFAPEEIKYNFTTQSNAEIFSDFLDAFIEEGSAEVEKLENIIGEWEKDVSVEAHYADVCRTLHTVKGIAKGVGLQRMGTLVHNFETLLEGLPRPVQDEETLYFRVVNIWLDAVVRGIEHITGEREDILSEIPQVGGPAKAQPQVSSAEDVPVEEVVHTEGASIIEKAEAQSKEQSKNNSAQENDDENREEVVDELVAEPSTEQDLQVSMLSALEKKRDKQLADEGAKVLAAQQSVRMTSEKLDLLLNLASQAQQLGVRASQNTSRSKRSSSELQGRLTSVRTHISKIADRALFNVNARAGGTSAEMDALEMDQYSELQEAASILREGVEDLSDLIDVVSRQNIQVEALLKQQSSVISSISSSIQGARVVPVSRLMPGLRRIVRTVSTDLGKTVSFNVVNETGALDRDHYARLQTVLEHMVRNALDHGIESADDRLAAGKPMGGRITIDVRKSGGDYIIRLSDDGKGIDADAIRQSAYEKGLDIDVDELSDDEAIRLIFHKGFSTANQLSEISGRGVGMDIVLTELQQIGGDISIQSAVGLGTSFEVRIPSNVSVNGALLVAAADQNYAIPLNGLIAVEQVPVDEFFSAVEKGESLGLFDLECEPAYLGTLCHSVAIPDRTFWDSFVPVIIAGAGNNHMAIAIDNVEEALELVVRSLGSQFSTVPGVAGAATTADGEALVALDLNLLVDSIGADGVAAVGKVEHEERQSLLALVVDDSRTQRMVATSQLETTGVETVTAENGLVAIDLLNSTHRLPDVVLLDVEMPVKDGIETLREIRKSRRYGHIPVIMVTSRTGAKHRALAKDAGCNAYMGKPFNFPALIQQISELTGHKIELS